MGTRFILVAIAGLVSASCVEGERVIKVNADGSGTVVESIKLGAEAQSMEAALSQMDSKPDAEKRTQVEENLKARATKMGQGVRFVSLDKAPDGVQRITYAFADINQLVLDLTMSSPGSQEQAGAAPKKPLRFSLGKQGSVSRLTVTMPPAAAGAAAKARTPDDLAQGMKMMRGFLEGLKLRTVMEVPGAIAKATVPSEGSAATIFQVDFDAVMADESNFRKFVESADDPETFDPAKVQGIKGITFPQANEVVIDFK